MERRSLTREQRLRRVRRRQRLLFLLALLFCLVFPGVVEAVLG